MSDERHKLLARQIEKFLPTLDDAPKEFQEAMNAFFDNVNEAYTSFEEDRRLLERSMELSSNELFEANKEMRLQNQRLKETQERAEFLTAQLQAVFDNASVGIIAIDQDLKCILSNSTIQKLLGYSDDELKNKTILDLTYPDDLRKSMSTISAQKTGTPVSFNKRYLKKDGTFVWAKLTATRLNPNNKKLNSIAVIEDVTAQFEAQATIQKQQIQIQNAAIESAHAAGMSEIATGILHNVGNVLTSINVSVEAILKKLEKSVTANLGRANKLLAENGRRLPEFFANDPRAEKLVNFYQDLDEAIKNEITDQKRETRELMEKIQLIKDIIRTQQSYARGKGEFKEPLSLVELAESALLMQASSLARHDIKLNKKFSDAPVVLCQKAKLIHVILNLVKNAKEAMTGKANQEKVLTIEIGKKDESTAFLKISDTGVGINKEDLSKVFSHGFTTKQTGHGFGLHFCANAMMEMGGQIRVTSDGPDRGALFTLLFESGQEAFAHERITPTNAKAA